MNENPVAVRRALISVSDRKGVAEFAACLYQSGVEILSTGGTAAHLRAADIPVTDVAAVTDFPEMMEGRVKTLHPAILGGILGLRDSHAEDAERHDIGWIDLVVVNLYPFAATVREAGVTSDKAFENIDVGGPTMIRAAAKNMGWVGVVVDVQDYDAVAREIAENQSLSFATRRWLSAKAFACTAEYDSMIAGWLLPDRRVLSLGKMADLRYGENPHQPASLWRLADGADGVAGAPLLAGKPLSYNNLVDADAAFACAREFVEPACVIVKHATPCGVAVDENADDVFLPALSCDALSAFGGVVAFNRPCTEKMAQAVTNIFMEVVLAPAFTPEALALFANKPSMRLLQVDFSGAQSKDELKFIRGGVLIQQSDIYVPAPETFRVVTAAQPDEAMMRQLLFASKVVKHVKSNAVVLAGAFSAVGIGGGQVSRVDAVHMALRKAGERSQGAVLASDAFFPFRDSIDCLAGRGVKAVIQPGGSVRDEEVIKACDEQGIAMVFTGIRNFRH